MQEDADYVDVAQKDDVCELLEHLTSSSVVDDADDVANLESEVDLPEDEPPMDKKELKEEVLNTAKMLGSLSGFKLLMLDTENKFVSTGQAKEIAKAAGGKYHYIPKGDGRTVSNIASQGIAELRGS